jgi:hypothetical protein
MLYAKSYVFQRFMERVITLAVSTTMVAKEGRRKLSQRSPVRQLYACGRICVNHVTSVAEFHLRVAPGPVVRVYW